MPPVVIDNPIVNSPFAEPSRHYRFDDANNITADVIEGRRTSSYFVPIAAPKKRASKPSSTMSSPTRKKKRRNTSTASG
ncbi:type iii restriction res subunit : Type III restriction-modification enzyme,R/helicase subunit OS=Nitrolancea hollandica Lb GN=NITHO_2210002 PE=4 SV=1 [Gemmataceae bacterium]|nr:type iii restriction res subunit : Type III restriction-modification enzyme,R/helicase subunit OS=Nitrolancea hollandica Lb GN=NITHO_2210002 PE=4 SV=1 [Gemmataceae bacterium]VTU00856.1 type iii restriction res subunit : Type III restriction-modification enzyme,R/helicase subunit OS=Nitrolancea hollandica Lb GN=NITHO_2210002 PE=4 SV=1 [Gemmataceae bacterium]